MEISFLIVTKNRPEELQFTLKQLQTVFDVANHEVLIFIDGCQLTEKIQNQFSWVKWYKSDKGIGASGARAILYPKAIGQILIGLDDDAHPLNADFTGLSEQLFKQYPNVGVLAFQEIKGVFNSDAEALAQKEESLEQYLCSEFVGCGFAIRKEVYNSTRGFPVWIDIYGEESCVAIEVLANGYDILYTNSISVNHRVDRADRMLKGRNYFRFGKQLKNTAFYYLVYYPFPFLKIAKLFWHNFKKYGCRDWIYFKTYFQSMFDILIFLPQLMRHRTPVSNSVLKRSRELPRPKY